MKNIVKLLILILIFSFNNPIFLLGSSDKNIQMKPSLTSENFDNRLTRIQIKFLQEGKEKLLDAGTGFFINDNKEFIYLVSAGHLFKDVLKFLLDNKGTVICFQKFESKDGTMKETATYEIDLIDYWKKDLLMINESKDIGIIKLREFIKKEETPETSTEKTEQGGNKEVRQPLKYSVSINILSDEDVIKYEHIKKAEDIYFFGYPELPTLKQFDKSHSLNPLIRKGIISKLIDGKKVIIEGFASKGSSGSPVFVRREYVLLGGYRIEFRFIGLITQYFPVFLPKQGEPQIENAGLALVESVDNIIETLEDFKNSVKKDSH